jgi:flagellar FliJ protein
VPKFKFSLETLLRHRDDIEQRERDVLFRLNYKYQTEIRHRDGLSVKFRETMDELASKRMNLTDHLELNWFHLYMKRLTHEIAESEKRLAQIDAEVQTQKKVVIEASKKKKVLSSLKTKKEREFIAEMEKQEQKEIDEIVVTRFAGRESEYRRNSETPKPGALTKAQS